MKKTNIQCREWLLEAWKENEDFGSGGQKIKTIWDTERKTYHVINTANNIAYCSSYIVLEEIKLTPYIELWLNNTICHQCDGYFQTIGSLRITRLNNTLLGIAQACIDAEKIKKAHLQNTAGDGKKQFKL